MNGNNDGYMKIQIVGLGHVGQELLGLIHEKRELLKSFGLSLCIVSVSDSAGTILDERGLDPLDVLRFKLTGWKDARKYRRNYGALDAAKGVECDVAVELTPSTPSGEPGLSNIRAALKAGKNVVTANKGPLVVDFAGLTKTARKQGVELRYEATVAAHLPVFCLAESCFGIDELESAVGILNASTNYIIGEMEKGKAFQEALDETVRAGWAETNYSDDVDGVDSARKLVIVANALFGVTVGLRKVEVEGIRHIEPLIKEASRAKKRVKLLCTVKRTEGGVKMAVAPGFVTCEDPLATVNDGNMAIKCTFKTSKEIFVSAQFLGPKQTACAVLNDIVKVEKNAACRCRAVCS